MAIYRRIYTKIWADPWFETLGIAERLFFVYLFSNEHTSPSGMYQLSLRRMAFDMQMSQAEIMAILEKFNDDGKAYYDTEHSVVWVTKLREHNESSSPQLQKRIATDIADTPECPVKARYLEKYDADTVSIPSNDDVQTTSSGTGTVQKQISTGIPTETGQDAPPSADALAASLPDSPDSQSRSPPDPTMRGRYRERIVALWESKNKGPITDQDANQLVSWCNEHGTNTVWTAMQKALAANANNLGGYMRTVLESQQTRGP